jgi:DNA-binding response OmpR family regulator
VPGRILIVDDEPNQLRSLAIGLRLEGFDVFEATESEQALRLLEEEPMDLAIVDLMMPGVNGLELTRRLRFRHPGVLVVLTSAYHLSENQLRNTGLEAVGFLPKPYRLDELSVFLNEKIGGTSVNRA